jgi:beta-glucosidase
MTCVNEGDLEAVAARIDFLGVNCYRRNVIRNRAVPEDENLPQTVFSAPKDDTAWTEMDWEAKCTRKACIKSSAACT